MDVQIFVPADEVWSFFQSNKDRLKKEMVIIAENTDSGYSIYLTEDTDLPMFSVCRGDAPPEYEEWAVSENDCTVTIKQLCARYLFPVTVCSEKEYPQSEDIEDEDGADDYYMTRQDMEDEQYQREDELQLAMCDFLEVALGTTDVVSEYGLKFVDNVLDDFLSYLVDDHGCEIYRPMILTDEETGGEIFAPFPYNLDAEYMSITDDEVV